MDEDFISAESSEDSDDGNVDESGMNSLKQGKKGRKANAKFSTPRPKTSSKKTPSKKQQSINTVQSTPTRRSRGKIQTPRLNVPTPRSHGKGRTSRGKGPTPRGKGPTSRSKAKNNPFGGADSPQSPKKSDPADDPENIPSPSKSPTQEATLQPSPILQEESPTSPTPDQSLEQERQSMAHSQENSGPPSQSRVCQTEEEPQDSRPRSSPHFPPSSPLSFMSKTPCPAGRELDKESTGSNMD